MSITDLSLIGFQPDNTHISILRVQFVNMPNYYNKSILDNQSR